MSHPRDRRLPAAFHYLGLVGAALLLAAACAPGDSATAGVAGAEANPSPPAERYPSRSWMARLAPPVIGDAVPIPCFDANRDLHLDGEDSPALLGLDIVLVNEKGCLPPMARREWFAANSPVCNAAAPRAALIVAVGGGGTDLLDTNEGVSAGLIAIVNGIRAYAASARVTAGVLLTTSAIKAADMPQTRLEEWLAHDLARRLDAAPCLRVALAGHSHGAVVITSVLARLEDRYSDRLYGVLLDRSLLYYDRAAAEFPSAAAILNVFQTNEGWHGEPLITANVTNLDMSSATAPREPRDGPEPIVGVAHSTLDDAPAVQSAVVSHVVAWLLGQ
jgi:alpha-beta hydrolase superfamily lysophospholipase